VRILTQKMCELFPDEPRQNCGEENGEGHAIILPTWVREGDLT